MAIMRVHRAALILAALLIAVSTGVIYARYQHDIHQARERVSKGSQLTQTPCGPIEFAVTGDGSPVLVVHGAGGGFDQGLNDETSGAIILGSTLVWPGNAIRSASKKRRFAVGRRSWRASWKSP